MYNLNYLKSSKQKRKVEEVSIYQVFFRVQISDAESDFLCL